MEVGKYIGIPYLAGGRDAKTGLDCFGLMLIVMRDRGHDLPDDGPDVEGYADRFTEVDAGNLMTGDVILFRDEEGVASHVGVYIGGGEFIRALCGAGVVKSRLGDRAIQRRVVGYYRMKAKA